MASKIANFASCLGKYDATLTGAAFSLDVSGAIGTSDLSLNSGYLTNSTGFVMPAANTGNGISFTGWFNPTVAEPSNYTPIFDISCGGTQSITLCVSGNSLSPVLVGNFNGNQVYGTTATANSWNFFAYTICCSGSTLVQTLFVNGTTTSITNGTYTALTFASTLVGYGYGTFAQQFIGKIDDFRYYGRVLTPMEMRVLNSYSYGKTGFASLTPSMSNVSISLSSSTTNLFTFPNTGTYSYIQMKRIGSDSTNYTANISPASMIISGSNYLYTDTVSSSATYMYSLTPYILGTPGTAITVSTPPSAMTITGAYLTATTFSLAITGGVGYGVTYSYDIGSGFGVGYTTSSNTSQTPTVTVTNSSVNPWTVTVKATNSYGTSTSSSTTVASNPFTITPAITNWQSATDVSGTSTTNGINYKVYAFKSTGISYTVTYTCNVSSYIYVLAVGGGGGGSAGGGGGGGGGGGVVMNPVLLPATTNTIVVNVGAGGASIPAGTNTGGNNGSPTTVTINANTSANIYVYAGGAGNAGGTVGNAGGSCGGGGYADYATAKLPPISQYNNFGNYGGFSFASSGVTGGNGGGGAGVNGGGGLVTTTGYLGGPGGNGIQCFLPGIKDFSPSGTSYGTYYWGGGGGGSTQTSGIVNCYWPNMVGKGGLGGGGGGADYSGAVQCSGGLGITTGGSGITNGGSGGANTGGGGGAIWAVNASGAGGSGIVVIAFPQTQVTSNTSAVLPSSLVTSAQYNAVLNNASLTTSAYNSVKGAFACKLINYNYFGPVMTLRATTDPSGVYTTNFYADVCGNMGTGYMGTGQSVSAWLTANGANTTYAYVTKWYNQGMDICFNSATQYTVGNQPVYEVATGVINYGYTTGYTPGTNLPSWSANAGNAYLNLPYGALPINDISYTYTTRHYQMQTSAYGTFIAGGTGWGGGGKKEAEMVYNTSTGYSNSWPNWGASDSNITYTANNVLSYMYASLATPISLYVFVNGTKYSSAGGGQPATLRAQDPSGNAIGYNWGRYTNGGSSMPLNGQLYNMYVFSTALADADRALVEATPYTYATPAAITGLATSAVTATTFVLSWTQVSGASYHVLWINGSVYASYGNVTTTGTVIPGTSGPWNVNLYAYNTSNGLLASGTTTAIYYYTGVGAPSFCLIGSSLLLPTRDVTNNYAVVSSGMTMTTDPLNQRGYCFNIKPAVSSIGTVIYVSYAVKSSITVAFWVKSNNTSLNIGDITGAGNTQFYWQLSTTTLSLNNPGYGGMSAPSSFTSGGWTHLAYTYNGTTVVAYVNGVQQSGTTSGSAFTMNTTQSFYFGDVGVGSGNGYGSGYGAFNNVYIWDTILTPSQIASVYANT